jgi:hypothetical protein
MCFWRGVGAGTPSVWSKLIVSSLWLASLACGSNKPAPRSAADDALLRDQVLDDVMAEENARRAAVREERAQTANSNKAKSTSRGVGVRGITGSLNSFEVEQAMQTRNAELLACVEQRPRAMGYVAGDIAFHVDVDGRGKVERVAVTESDIGYEPLETCLTSVVATAPFPAPAGAQAAEAQWRMSVDPLREPALPLDGAELEDTIERQSEAAYETCSVERGQRFIVNGYLAHGKLRPVSVRAPWRGAAKRDQDAESQSCLQQALEQWSHWPKADGNAKVSFELRWVAAPKPTRAHGRAKRKR